MTAALTVVGLMTVLLIVALAGCGASGRGRASGPFGWLRPASAPSGWNVGRTEGGAVLAYPPGWKPIKTDPGTATVALLGAGERIDGYLNATPRQGNETLADWSVFARTTTMARATAACGSSPPPPTGGFARDGGRA